MVGLKELLRRKVDRMNRPPCYMGSRSHVIRRARCNQLPPSTRASGRLPRTQLAPGDSLSSSGDLRTRRQDDKGQTDGRSVLLDFSQTLQTVVDVGTCSAKSCARWLGTAPKSSQRYLDAMMRHLRRWTSTDGLDPETGLPHLAHVAWNALCGELQSPQEKRFRRGRMKPLVIYHGMGQTASVPHSPLGSSSATGQGICRWVPEKYVRRR